MNPRELVSKGTDEVIALSCSSCDQLFRLSERELAERCCLCTRCGKSGEIGPSYLRNHSECDRNYYNDQKKQEDAKYMVDPPSTSKRVEATEYDGGWIYYKQRFFGSVEDLLSRCEQEKEPVPVWVTGCEERHMAHIDARDMIENHLENGEHHEDAMEEVVDMDELEEFLDAWCDKQPVKSYLPDPNVAVMVRTEKTDG